MKELLEKPPARSAHLPRRLICSDWFFPLNYRWLLTLKKDGNKGETSMAQVAPEEKNFFLPWNKSNSGANYKGKEKLMISARQPSDGSSDFGTSEVVSGTFFRAIRWVRDGWLLDPLPCWKNMRKHTVKSFERKSLQSGRWSSSGNAVNWNRLAGLEAKKKQ